MKPTSSLSTHALSVFSEFKKSNVIIAATDGGCKDNGTSKCIATYGVSILHPSGIDKIIKFAEQWKLEQSMKKYGKRQADIKRDDVEMYDFQGIISNEICKEGINRMRELKVDVYKGNDGKEIKNSICFEQTATPTNNRGELTAINVALDNIMQGPLNGDIILLSDSEYSIKSIDIWSRNWFNNPVKHSLNSKLNLDLVAAAQSKLDKLRANRNVTCEHIKSHKSPPDVDTKPMEWLKWYMNDRVDILAGMGLGRE